MARPLVDARIRTEFGDVLADDTGSEEHRLTQDITYTPGFSEMRVARDVAIAEAHKGLRKQEDIPVLTHNVRLARRTNKAGVPDSQKQMQAANRGYRMITAKDLGQPWFKEVPPGAVELPGGGYTKGDCVYMVCDGKTAAKNQAEKTRLMYEMSDLKFAESEGGIGKMGGTMKRLSSKGHSISKGEVFDD